MTPLDKQARIAGLWFLVVILAAPVRLVVVPDGSARDVIEHLALFRAGILTDLLSGVAMLVAAELFWGLWLLPLAMLVWHSGFLPRLLAAWLLLNGIAYIAQCITGFAWPSFAPTLSSLCAPVQFGEIAFALWLIALGARPGFRQKELA